MGLLTGAMAGLGAGLSQTGDFLMQVTAEEEKEKRLRQYEMAREKRQNQRQDMIRSEDREWQLEDYDKQREHSLEDYQMQRTDQVEDRDFQANFTLKRDDTQYERQMAMERYRQSQQNARSAASRAASRRQQPKWQLMPDGNGGYIQYDPVTNQSRAANLPEGVGATNEWGDRDKALMNAFENEYSALSKRAETMGVEALDPSEQRRLKELPTLMQQHITGMDAGDVDAELDAALGVGGVTPSGADNTMEEEGGGTIPGLVNRELENRSNDAEAAKSRREATQARKEADRVIGKVEREKVGGATPGGLMAGINEAAGRGGGISQETLNEAQSAANNLIALDNNPNISADQKRWIAERLIELKNLGVPVNLP
ncbi:hypothetical protein ACU6TU_08460 [Halomonas sp. LS-001]